jgi:hypothetical protein
MVEVSPCGVHELPQQLSKSEVGSRARVAPRLLVSYGYCGAIVAMFLLRGSCVTPLAPVPHELIGEACQSFSFAFALCLCSLPLRVRTLRLDATSSSLKFFQFHLKLGFDLLRRLLPHELIQGFLSRELSIPARQCRGEHEVVVVGFSPVRVGVMRRRRVDLHSEVQ